MIDVLNVLPYGDRALLVELAPGDDVLTLRAHLLAAELAGVDELVPGATTLLIRVDPAVVDEAALRGLLGTAPRRPQPDVSGSAPELIEVRYDGADLDEVARLAGGTVKDVVAWHSAPSYTVAFSGFAPGFGYLRELDERLRLPRRASPRGRVPAGSVAIAAEYTAVYPRESPGGWWLVGHTDAQLWDLERTPPSLLTPGTRVRFLPR